MSSFFEYLFGVESCQKCCRRQFPAHEQAFNRPWEHDDDDQYELGRARSLDPRQGKYDEELGPRVSETSSYTQLEPSPNPGLTGTASFPSRSLNATKRVTISTPFEECAGTSPGPLPQLSVPQQLQSTLHSDRPGIDADKSAVECDPVERPKQRAFSMSYWDQDAATSSDGEEEPAGDVHYKALPPTAAPTASNQSNSISAVTNASSRANTVASPSNALADTPAVKNDVGHRRKKRTSTMFSIAYWDQDGSSSEEAEEDTNGAAESLVDEEPVSPSDLTSLSRGMPGSQDAPKLDLEASNFGPQSRAASFASHGGPAHSRSASFASHGGPAHSRSVSFASHAAPAQSMGASFSSPRARAQSTGASLALQGGPAQSRGASFSSPGTPRSLDVASPSASLGFAGSASLGTTSQDAPESGSGATAQQKAHADVSAEQREPAEEQAACEEEEGEEEGEEEEDYDYDCEGEEEEEEEAEVVTKTSTAPAIRA